MDSATNETLSQEILNRIETIQDELRDIQTDLAAKGVTLDMLQGSMFGTLGVEDSQQKSLLGRLQNIQRELENLKKAQEDLKRAQEKGEEVRERYTTGAILAALGTAVGWAMSRILGGP